MNIRIDIHTHTISSGHAFSSLQEMAKAAAEKGLDILGITDHASSLPGAPSPIYFRNLHVVPREMYGVRLLLGAELNILDTSGRLDLEPFYYRILLCSQHAVISGVYISSVIDIVTGSMVWIW